MRIGVLLGGCGLYDGSDPHETVLLLLALEAAGEKALLIAPDIPQERTIDHLTAEAADGPPRGILQESARLGRGRIRPLASVRPDELEALIVPGGYGPVVNFATGFARAGERLRIRPEIAGFLGHFVEAGKPIATIGLGEIPVRAILGLEIDSPPQAEPRGVALDPVRRIVHTAGFAGFTRLSDVRAGIEAMVAGLLGLLQERGREEAASRRDASPP